MSARQFGRDSGDIHGQHFLREPGGDNRQRDVSHLVGGSPFGMYVNPDYIGRHRPKFDTTDYAVAAIAHRVTR
jgi:hypothetical protein